MSTFARAYLLLSCVLSLENREAVQEARMVKPTQNSVVSRFSYTSTYGVDGNREHYLPRMCFEVYRDGRYRIARTTTKNVPENRAGVLSQAQLDIISRMLTKLDSSNSSGSIVRKGSESFVAEISNGTDETTRFVWIDPDHERPFPESVVNIVNWLQSFKAESSTVLNIPELSTEPICPRMADRSMQPVSLLQNMCP
jgi:hypothetical protein